MIAKSKSRNKNAIMASINPSVAVQNLKLTTTIVDMSIVLPRSCFDNP